MEKLLFEQMMAKNYKEPSEAEKNWDARAEYFSMEQNKDSSGLSEKVTDILIKKNILKGANVLDIGGGSGRYAVPFARAAEHVTVADISSKMLEMSEINARKSELSNLSYVKTDWVGADLDSLGWRNYFDLSFASMCPAVRSPEGLRNMMAVSRGYCMINQFITDKNSMSSYIKEKLEIKNSHDPHNDRDMVQAVFNILWIEGYEPEIIYIRQNRNELYTADEAVKQYSRRYEQKAIEKNMNIEKIILNYSEDRHFRIQQTKTLAIILWQV